MTATDIYRTAIEAEIRERLAFEKWYRANGWADWPDLRRENMCGLRALLKVARQARKAERSEQLDPMTQAKAWRDAAPGELTEAWGR